MNRARPLVVLSSQYWDDNWFRKHQFAVRFARDGAQVFYVEPSHSIARRAHVAGVGSNPVTGVSLRRTAEGVTVMTPGRILPKPTIPFMSRLNSMLTLWRVQRALRRLGAVDPLYIVYDVRYATALGKAMRAGSVVLDLVDDLADYPGSTASRDHAKRCIELLAEGASAVSYTSSRLMELYPARRSHAVIPNGYDAALFNVGVEPAELPGKPPYVGFIGKLFSFLDYGLFASIVEEVPDITLVLVGDVEGTADEVENLLLRPNVVYLGPRPKTEIPSLVATFDVCIAPFLPGPVADAVSPLKLYEYLAMGKPVIATPLASVQADTVGPFVEFASGREEFAHKVRLAVEDGGGVDGEALGSVIAAYSWDALYARFRSLVLSGRTAEVSGGN